MPNQPDSNTLYVSQPLTNVSEAFLQDTDAYIADRVFPVVPVQQQGGLFWRYRREDWLRSVAGVRAPATETAGGGWEMDRGNYYALPYGVHKDIDDQLLANSSSMFNVESDATRWVTEQLLIQRERDFVASFLTTGVWTGGTGLGAGPAGADLTGAAADGDNAFVQFDRAGADPIGLIGRQALGMARRTGKKANTLVLGAEVEAALANSPAVIERIKYSERGIVQTDLLKALFGVKNVFTTYAIENIAPEGADGSFDFMNSKSALLCYAAPNAGLQTASAGYTFSWTGLLGAGALGVRIKRFRLEHIESTRIEGMTAYDQRVVAPDLGVFLSNAVQ